MRSHGRDLGWLAVSAMIGLPAPVLLFLVVASVPASVVAGLGVGFFAAAVWVTRRLAGVQRRRAAAVLGAPVPEPYRPLPAGALARLRVVLRDRATWFDFAWAACQFVAGLGSLVLSATLWLGAAQCLTAPVLQAVLPRRAGYDPLVLELTGRSPVLSWILVPIGVGVAVVAYRLPRRLVRGQARLAAALLGPGSTAVLAERVGRLTVARAATVDASAAELRRIERDLHDGAQARLVAMSMSLGVAEDVIDTDPAGAKALVAEARAGAGTALAELRDLVRGIHPPVLADRGLAAAVEALVLDTAYPADLDLRLDRRLAAPVEAAGYFAVAEALANAGRHSGATRVHVTVLDAGAALHITVRDDGHGGADPARGTGLLGIQRRMAAFDGTLRVSSPAGGPTVLEMELPCGS
ncbi:sensor histidine kinase, partial [Actinoplanes utahensis]|uniref:sensor histidine kinase n=1 Tax=Actinoplanes utahensis TaxID=1869 RepID=UPI0005B90D55